MRDQLLFSALRDQAVDGGERLQLVRSWDWESLPEPSG